MSIQLIAAVTPSLGMGKDGGLPWVIPEDLAHFRQITSSALVVMGRRTWESLPVRARPLSHRLNVVITSSAPEAFPAHPDLRVCTLAQFKEEVLPAYLNVLPVFVIGGAQLYAEFLPEAKILYLTQVGAEVPCDTHFPALPADWKLTEHSPRQVTAEGLPYQFLKYEKARKPNGNEETYLGMVRWVLEHGSERPDRTGTGTLSSFGGQMRFDISTSVPVLTTKRVPWKHCIEELLWFLRGDTDNRHLQARGVKIWNGNSSRAFMDKVGLTHLDEGDCGANYSFQWRHFGAEYRDCTVDYTGQGVDQIEAVLHLLRTDPFSRRIFLSAWNPADLTKTVLPPCHVSAQFYVEEAPRGGPRYLSCHMYQRSCDLFLGEPWNILSYSVLTYILAAKAGLRPKELIISLGDVHIYKDHVDQVAEQLSREVRAAPVLSMSEAIKDKSWTQLELNDFELIGYFPHPPIRAPMAV